MKGLILSGLVAVCGCGLYLWLAEMPIESSAVQSHSDQKPATASSSDMTLNHQNPIKHPPISETPAAATPAPAVDQAVIDRTQANIQRAIERLNEDVQDPESQRALQQALENADDYRAEILKKMVRSSDSSSAL